MSETKTREELERELKTTVENLEEVEEMRAAVLGQTGVHIGAKELNRYYSHFDGDKKRFEERIAQIKAQLAELDSSAQA